MLKALGSRLTYANVVATGALFLALGGGAYALSGVPDRGGVFHGCVSNATGVLRVVKSARSCQKAKTVRRNGRKVRLPGEFAVAWNQQGRPGQNGANGANGANGTNGATNAVVRTRASDIANGGQTATSVPCNAGERAVGGGVGPTALSLPLSSTYVLATYPGNGTLVPPTPGQAATSWNAAVQNGSGSTRNFTWYAVCESP